MNMLPLKSLFRASLVNVRIVFLFVAFVHLLVTAIVTLNIDTTVDEDPKVRAYYYVRWKLITFWFNLITLAYLPARLYCDLKTSMGEKDSGLARNINHAADVVFTAILFPVVVYSDVTFWIIFKLNPDILAPPRIFDVYLPHWAQHSLHTVSFCVVIFDLVVTPRQKPRNMMPRVALLLAFSLAYIFMVAYNYWRGEMVYQVLEITNAFYLSLISMFSLITVFVLFSLQWVAVEYIWGHKVAQKFL